MTGEAAQVVRGATEDLDVDLGRAKNVGSPEPLVTVLVAEAKRGAKLLADTWIARGLAVHGINVASDAGQGKATNGTPALDEGVEHIIVALGVAPGMTSCRQNKKPLPESDETRSVEAIVRLARRSGELHRHSSQERGGGVLLAPARRDGHVIGERVIARSWARGGVPSRRVRIAPAQPRTYNADRLGAFVRANRLNAMRLAGPLLRWSPDSG